MRVEIPNKYDSSLDQTAAAAWNMAESHQLKQATQLFRHYLSDEGSLHAHFEYARFLATFESPDLAIAYLEGMLADSMSFPHSPEELRDFYNQLAALHRDCGNISQAKQTQQIAIRYDLSLNRFEGLSPTTRLGQAHDLYLQNELEAAKYLLISLQSRSDMIRIDARISLGEIYLKENESLAAKLVLQEAFDATNDVLLQVKALRLMTEACMQNDDYSSAVESVNAAIELASSSARCVNELAQLEVVKLKLKLQQRWCAQTPEWN